MTDLLILEWECLKGMFTYYVEEGRGGGGEKDSNIRNLIVIF